jgi:hypothetical protein
MFDWLRKLLGVGASAPDKAAERLPDEPITVVVPCPYAQHAPKKKDPEPEWRVHLELDLNRDGKYVEVMHPEAAPWAYGEGGKSLGAVLPFNNDGDNDAAPAGDHEDNRAVTELDLADLTELRIRLEPADRPFPVGWTCLVGVDRVDRIRIFDSYQPGAGELIGPTSRRDHVYLALHPPNGSHAPLVSRLGMEAVCLPSADFDGQVQLGIALFDDTGNMVGEERTAALRVTPWLMSHHLQPVEVAYVVDRYVTHSMPPGPHSPPPVRVREEANGAYVDRLRRAAGGTLMPLELDLQDNWLRDMFYGGCSRGPTMDEPILQIVRCPSTRGRKGEAAAYELMRRLHVNLDHGWAEPIAPRDIQSDLDSGGNLLCSPPVDGHPFGRIVYGHDDNRPMSADIVRFLCAQDAQAPFRLDTSWLQVGHIDEVLTFIPWPQGKDPVKTSSHGFRVLVASPATALTLLQRSAGENLLFHGFHQQQEAALVIPDALREQKMLDMKDFSAAQVLQSKVLTAAAEEIEPILEGIVATLMEQLGIRPEDVMRMPVLFHRYGAVPREAAAIKKLAAEHPMLGGVPEKQQRKAHVAFTPNVVNMLVMTGDDGRAQLLIPKPFGPSSGKHDKYGCSFEAYIAYLLAPSGNTLAFVDDFAACHLHTGEIHCTTFEVRKAPENPAFWARKQGSGTVSPASDSGGKPALKRAPPPASSSGSTWRATLNDGEYLDDEVMRRFYADIRRRVPAGVQLVDPANSYMILNNVNEVEAAAELAALTQNDAALVFFPVNNNRNSARQGGTHWTLIVYTRAQNQFDYYDSLNRAPDAAANAAHARLQELYQSQAVLTRRLAPQQQESECGVYVLLITEHLAVSHANAAAPNVPGLANIQNPRQRIRDALP